MYCRLLQHSVKEAEQVAGSPLPAISHFSEDQSSELRDRIFDEFNTLSVILRAHSAAFIREVPSTLEEEEPDAPLVSHLLLSSRNQPCSGHRHSSPDP